MRRLQLCVPCMHRGHTDALIALPMNGAHGRHYFRTLCPRIVGCVSAPSHLVPAMLLFCLLFFLPAALVSGRPVPIAIARSASEQKEEPTPQRQEEEDTTTTTRQHTQINRERRCEVAFEHFVYVLDRCVAHVCVVGSVRIGSDRSANLLATIVQCDTTMQKTMPSTSLVDRGGRHHHTHQRTPSTQHPFLVHGWCARVCVW